MRRLSLSAALITLVVFAAAQPAQAAAPRDVLLVSAYNTTQALDPRTGAVVATFDAGADGVVSRSGRRAYVRDVDPCHPDIEGCFGARDLLVAAPDGTGERVIMHNPEAQGGVAHPDWSPDGTKLVYSWLTQGERGIFLINADGTGDEPVAWFSGPGTFSPDGRSIAFVKDGDVQVVDLATKAVRQVTADGLALHTAVDYSPDGRTIVYAAQYDFRTVPAAGGESTRAGQWPNQLSDVSAPVFSPNGRQVAFSAYERATNPEQPDVRRLFVAAVDGSTLTALADTYAQPTDWIRR
jgi:TolB protein